MQIIVITALKIFAWVMMLTGVVGSVGVFLFYRTLMQVQLGVGGTVQTATSAFAAAAMFIAIFLGLVSWAVLLALAYVVENLLAIRENTTPLIDEEYQEYEDKQAKSRFL